MEGVDRITDSPLSFVPGPLRLLWQGLGRFVPDRRGDGNWPITKEDELRTRMLYTA